MHHEDAVIKRLVAHPRISFYNNSHNLNGTCHSAERVCHLSRSQKGAHVEYSRVSGILLHPTSLPGPFGIGDLGSGAYRFISFLRRGGQRVWQILPLGPTGYGNSPYQTYSAVAGNPLLLSLEKLREEGLLSAGDLQAVPPFPQHRVDYDAVREFKGKLLWRAFEHFQGRATGPQGDDLAAFAAHQAEWLEDYALFMALKEAHQGVPWNQWERSAALREPAALEGWRKKLAPRVQFHQFLQYQFFRQWQSIKVECQQHGIQLFGDVPIFIAHDSADVWAHPELFHLDEMGNPTVVAGVPPDYFSRTGQLWGNPLYRWEVMAASGYAWWIQRLRTAQQMVDMIRLDHFRGFEAYWEVPAAEDTAVNGRWVEGPRAAFFEALRDALGELPIVAEDLGLITPEVRALRDHFGFPGMRVLQFAFGGDPGTNEHAPHNYTRNCVVYTGTHDNNTSLGWLHEVERPENTSSREQMVAERAMALKYMASNGKQIHWDMIRLALASVGSIAVIPMQDVLGLGHEARMNHPGMAQGNWEWRYTADMLTDELTARLHELTEIYGRIPSKPGE
jgi:4-alpha-glucanotransferase